MPQTLQQMHLAGYHAGPNMAPGCAWTFPTHQIAPEGSPGPALVCSPLVDLHRAICSETGQGSLVMLVSALQRRVGLTWSPIRHPMLSWHTVDISGIASAP